MGFIRCLIFVISTRTARLPSHSFCHRNLLISTTSAWNHSIFPSSWRIKWSWKTSRKNNFFSILLPPPKIIGNYKGWSYWSLGPQLSAQACLRWFCWWSCRQIKDISFRFYHTKINRKKMLVVIGRLCREDTTDLFAFFWWWKYSLSPMCHSWKRLSSVTSLFTILEWMPLATPNVVTKVFTNDFVQWVRSLNNSILLRSFIS